MDARNGGVVPPDRKEEDIKAAKKQSGIQFKAQHALVLAFFLLIL